MSNIKHKKDISFANIIKIQKIEEYMKSHNLSEKRFAEKCNLSLKELQAILQNHDFFEPIWIFKISRVMGI